MNWYLAALRKYATFEGRARRKEYWMFALFNVLVAFVAGIIDALTGTFDEEIGMGLLGGLYALAVILPSIAVAVRRLHDTSRSGWWVLIGFVPVLGVIVLFVFMVLDSTPGSNSYGPNPKGVTGPGEPIPA
jgi:uncharacterized membrane protein YhaH (DUF805 family)